MTDDIGVCAWRKARGSFFGDVRRLAGVQGMSLTDSIFRVIYVQRESGP